MAALQGDPFQIQPPDSEAVFGLTDNPFDPEGFADVDENALSELWSFPLAIDEHPALERLFVIDAGPFDQGRAKFAQQMHAAGYRFGPDRCLGKKSVVFRVIGPRGSGKSTLTNYLILKLKSCAPANELLLL